jgi:hypothetical protein
MMTDPASGIRHEVQQLIQLQIDTLRLESSLTSSQLWEYHSRSQRITALYGSLTKSAGTASSTNCEQLAKYLAFEV